MSHGRGKDHEILWRNPNSRGSLGFHGIGVVHAKGSLEVALPPNASLPPAGPVLASRRCASHSASLECAACRAAGQMASASSRAGCGGCGARMAALRARVVIGCDAPLTAMAPRPQGTTDVGALLPYLEQHPQDHHGAKRRTTPPKPAAHPTLGGHHRGFFFQAKLQSKQKPSLEAFFGKSSFHRFDYILQPFSYKRLNYITISSNSLPVCGLVAHACSCCSSFPVEKFVSIEISCFD